MRAALCNALSHFSVSQFWYGNDNEQNQWECGSLLLEPRIVPAMDELIWGLHDLRKYSAPEDWDHFAPGLRDVGYMETFMGWRLIYRDEDGLAETASYLPIEQIRNKRTFRDEFQNIVFLEIERR